MQNHFLRNNEHLVYLQRKFAEKNYRRKKKASTNTFRNFFIGPSLLKLVYSANQKHIETIFLRLQFKFRNKKKETAIFSIKKLWFFFRFLLVTIRFFSFVYFFAQK